MVVRMRHTHAHTANRRSHHALKGARFITCPKCNAKHLMHRVCGNCGNYRGREVVDVMKKTIKKAAKVQARKDAGKPEEVVPEAKAVKAAKAEKTEKKEAKPVGKKATAKK